MIINLHALAGLLDSEAVYFSISDGKNGKVVYSPLYPDQDACVQAIRQTILWLRTLKNEIPPQVIAEADSGYVISLLAEKKSPFLKPIPFAEKDQAILFLQALQKESQADLFSINSFKLTLEKDKNKWSEKPIHENSKAFTYSSFNGIRFSSSALVDKTIYSFSLVDRDGQTILNSQKFESSDSRDEAFYSTLRSLLIPDCFVENERDGLHYYSLYSPERVLLGDGQQAENKSELTKQIQQIQQCAKCWAIIWLPEYYWKATNPLSLNLAPPKTSSALTAAASGMPILTKFAKKPCAPIFNVLRPYGKSEINRFFGRETETEELYEQLFDTRLLVLYGERSVGKTSLVQCGLANRLPADQWHDIYFRRQMDINSSLSSKLREKAMKLGCADITKHTKPMDALRAIYLKTFQPILLVFDQLEDLFSFTQKIKEQQEFFLFLQELIQDTSFPAKVILVIRDEQLGKLADYENIVPTLLDHRFHLKHLSASALKVVLNGLLGYWLTVGKIKIEKPEIVKKKIQENLIGDKPAVGPACTQVYLHQAHQLTCKSALGNIPIFKPELIDQVGKSEEAIRSYVDERISVLEKEIQTAPNLDVNEAHAQEIENLMQMQKNCGCQPTEARSLWLSKWQERGQKNKELGWFLRLSMFGLLFGAIASSIVYCSLNKQDPCLVAQTADNCEARINYLCHNGLGSDCANNVMTQLDGEDCPVWIDYKEAVLKNTCESYRQYVDKYRTGGVCLDRFYKILAERDCPSATDTIISVKTDTVIQRVISENLVIPPGYEKVAEPKKPITSKECVEQFGKATLKLGPLFMMTEDLNHATRYDWVSALAACKRLGPNWRLPCAGEIDFILIKHYSESASAFQHLTSGPCPLFTEEDAALSGSFWTATEANDHEAWSIFFDTKNDQVKMVSGMDKKTTLPCRCVYRDTSLVSGMPDCLEKSVYRPEE